MRRQSKDISEVMFPQKLCISPSSPYRASHPIALTVVFTCALCELGARLRTNQECYLLFDWLVAVVEAGARLEFLCCWSRRQRDLILPLQTASLTLGRGTQIPCLSAISAKSSEPNSFDMNGRVAKMSCLFTDPVARERTVI